MAAGREGLQPEQESRRKPHCDRSAGNRPAAFCSGEKQTGSDAGQDRRSDVCQDAEAAYEIPEKLIL